MKLLKQYIKMLIWYILMMGKYTKIIFCRGVSSK